MHDQPPHYTTVVELVFKIRNTIDLTRQDGRIGASKVTERSNGDQELLQERRGKIGKGKNCRGQMVEREWGELYSGLATVCDTPTDTSAV